MSSGLLKILKILLVPAGTPFLAGPNIYLQKVI